MTDDRPSIHQLSQDLSADDNPLDLAGSFPNFAHLGVPHHALDRILRRIAVAAEDLYRLSSGAHGQFGAVQLGHSGFFLERPAILLEPCRMIQKMSTRLDLERHVCQLKAHALEAADCPAELLAHTSVSKSLFVRSLRDPQ